MKKILTVIVLLGVLFFAFIIVLYIRGLRKEEYTCAFDDCTITLYTFTNDNSFQSTGYELTLKVTNEAGLTQQFELGADPFDHVKIESAALVKGDVRKDALIATTPSGISYLIDKNTLTGRIDFDIESGGNIEYHQTLLMPDCASEK